MRFTLVELIVILVILAVIAAALVSALTGYVKRARKVKSLSKADAARLAAQSEFAEFLRNVRFRYRWLT